MKALVLKDFYVIVKQMKFFLLFIVIFSLIPGNSVSLFAVTYSAMLPYTSMAYDERSHWDQLAVMMPYSTREIVLSKYMLGWVCIAASSLLSIIAQTLLAPFVHTQPDHFGTLMAACMGAVLVAVTLPLLFRFGVERGRMAFILLIVFCVSFAGGIIGVANAALLDGILSEWVLLILFAAAVVLTTVSIPLSIRLYRVQ